MTTESFEEWWKTRAPKTPWDMVWISEADAEAAWNHQQEKIERLNSSIILLRDIKDAEIAELKKKTLELIYIIGIKDEQIKNYRDALAEIAGTDSGYTSLGFTKQQIAQQALERGEKNEHKTAH